MIKKLLFLPELGKSIIISDEKFSLKIVPHETGDSQLLILEYIPSKDVIEIGSFSSYDEALDKIKYMTQLINNDLDDKYPKTIDKSGVVIPLNNTSFEASIVDGLCLVFFWAFWAGSCRSMIPTIDSLASAYTGSLKVFSLDTDKYLSIAEKYCVRTIPNCIIFFNGIAQESIIGDVSLEVLSKKVNSYLAVAKQ